MIKLDSYTEEFEEIYWKVVEEKVSVDVQKYIVCSSEKFLPEDFWGGVQPVFKTIILAPFEKLKSAYRYIKDSQNFQIMKNEYYTDNSKKQKLKSKYQELVEAYEKVANSIQDGNSIRVILAKNSGLTVCPFCNRDYINCRGKNTSGAQLDHFFEKSKYPVFALSLYNLIPVCGNCNRIKSKQNVEFASPFDKTIDWENDVVFQYETDGINKVRILIKGKSEAINNNIKGMRIEESYQIHDIEVEELLKKRKIYCQTQQQEFQDVLYKINLSEQDIKLAVFGPRITAETMKTKPLSKMMSDLYKTFGIY